MNPQTEELFVELVLLSVSIICFATLVIGLYYAAKPFEE